MNNRQQLGTGICICLVLFTLGAGCNKNQGSQNGKQLLAAATLAATMEQTQDAVVWLGTGQGDYTSYWVRGNSMVIDFVLQKPHLLIPRPGGVWQWRVTKRPVAVCDCKALAILENQGPCPLDEESFTAEIVTLTDLISGEELALAPPPEISPEENEKLAEFSYRVVPLSSIGPFLFVNIQESRVFCDGGAEETRQRFLAYDLDSKDRAEILTPEELDKIAKIEQVKAWKSASDTPQSSAKSPSDMILAGIEPQFVGPFNLLLSYHFSSEESSATLSSNEDNATPRSNGEQAGPSFFYSNTVKIPADTLPRSILTYAIPPDVVRNFYTNDEIGNGRGWTPISGSQEELVAMWDAFTKAE